jgi:hypothetical protein
VYTVEGDSKSSAFRCNLPVEDVGRLLGGIVELVGFETCLRPFAGLSYCPYCLSGPDAAFLCGLALGEWSMSWREALEGDICCAARPDRAAPLLARLRRATGDCALASVDCDHRLRLPNPSPTGFSDGSSALLLLRRDVPPPTRKAISDSSPGLCEPIGSTEFRALSPGEVSEPARLIVVAVEPEDDLGREDRRLDGVALAGFHASWRLLSRPEADVQPSSTTRLFCSPTAEHLNTLRALSPHAPEAGVGAQAD